MEIGTFTCSICGETSLEICVYCTKDTCPNHICQRCLRCVDCCVCEMPLTRDPEVAQAHSEPELHTEPEPELPRSFNGSGPGHEPIPPETLED